MQYKLFCHEPLSALAGIPSLDVGEEVRMIGNVLVERAALPEKARVDALHISTAAFHGIDYLLTWNCKHIANPRMRPKIEKILTEMGCAVPIICTPNEMLGDE